MPDEQVVDLAAMTWNELRKLAKERGVPASGVDRMAVEEALEAALVADAINQPAAEAPAPAVAPPEVVPADEPVPEFNPVDGAAQHELWAMLSGIHPGVAVIDLWDYRKQQERLDLTVQVGLRTVTFAFRPPYKRHITDEKGKASEKLLEQVKKLALEFVRGRLPDADLKDEVEKLDGVDLR